jgi:tetratricopeptide (TPR) repeat protein
LGQTEKAIQVYELALAALAENNLDALQNIADYREIANDLAKAGQEKMAQNTFELEIAVADNIDDASYKSDALWRIAKELAEVGYSRLAVKALEHALTAADKTDDAGKQAIVFAYIAEAFADNGGMTEAKPVLAKAVGIAEKISDEKMTTTLYGTVAGTYAKLNQYRLAREYAEKANTAGDTIKGYMAILKYYDIEKHPELAAKLVKLEKEDKR